MAEKAGLLVNEILPEQSMRQWVLNFQTRLRYQFGKRLGAGVAEVAVS